MPRKLKWIFTQTLFKYLFELGDAVNYWPNIDQKTYWT
ncbi:hypothetical protein MNBD_ALPHA11-1958 [hydrothermal vent metagenome]|uniref:Uncharacterized protein n=1 Tax=hydrothermal vent metagenome TaxID=652676 RepID=A0A3B0UYM2_9ZZZZ